MEPFTTAALATVLMKLADGAAGEAGKAAWSTLKEIVVARLGRSSRQAGAVAELEAAPDKVKAEYAAEVLHAAPDAAAWLGAWLEQAHAVAMPVHNEISGQAQVQKSVQNHTINGSITM